MKLVFATSNKGKLGEAQELLGKEWELLTPADLGIFEDIPETGTTLKENSFLKADYIHSHCHCDCFADDTGLEVDALGGAPGVYTARYAGPQCDFDDNIDKLLRELEGVPMEKRTAHFRCVVTLFIGDDAHYFEGDMPGKIALQRAGTGGFGYDPVFIPDAFPGQTLSEIGVTLKNSVSHRGQTLRALAAYLHSLGK